MARVKLKGVAASTHPMEVYGGIRISEEMVRYLAEKLRANEISFGLRHDPRIGLEAVVVDVNVRQDDDGETLAEIILEVDEEEYYQKGGADVGGFSVSATQPFLKDENAQPLVTISADAHWFSDSNLQAAYEELVSRGVPAQANRLYQFADVSTALVLVQLIGQQLATMPTGVLCSYVYDSLRHFFTRKETAQSATEPSDFDISFDPDSGRVTRMHIRTASDEILNQAINKLPDIIDSNIDGSHEYSEADQEWKRTD